MGKITKILPTSSTGLSTNKFLRDRNRGNLRKNRDSVFLQILQEKLIDEEDKDKKEDKDKEDASLKQTPQTQAELRLNERTAYRRNKVKEATIEEER